MNTSPVGSDKLRTFCFYHYSDTDISKKWHKTPLAQNGFYRQFPAHEYKSPLGKPRGFWLSVGNAWADWCRGERFHVASLKYKHRVYLKPDAKILLLDTPAKLVEFTEMYRSNHPKSANRVDSDYTYDLDWAAVARKYQGIIISPYRYDMRLEMKFMWYYGWDVASACIWDLAAIDEVVLLKTPGKKPSSPSLKSK